MKRIYSVFVILITVVSVSGQSLLNLRTEMQTDPLGIDVETPRLSWQISSEEQNVKQTSYRILAASSLEKIMNLDGDLWDSGIVSSGDSHLIPYKGFRPNPNQQVFWCVKVDTNVGESAWSDVATWSLGIDKWQGSWIGLDGLREGETEGDHSRLAARYLRRAFDVDRPVKRAMLHICGLGLYEAYINGVRVGENVNTPSPTAYDCMAIYNTYDVTGLLDGKSCLSVVLGNGWYYGRAKNIRTFGFPKLTANLIIEYVDGTSETIFTDENWKINTNGPIRSNNDYDGEIYDARWEIDWTSPSFDDTSWQSAEIVNDPGGKLVGNPAPAIKAVNLSSHPFYRGEGIRHLGDGLFDIGQNIAGWVSIGLDNIGNEGDTIRIRYAERLDTDGKGLYTDNLRTAQSSDYYICNGRDTGFWHPVFVTHGFRFLEIQNITANRPYSGSIEAYVVGDPMVQTGKFVCNNEVLNNIIENARWGILSNYKGLPTDCPQRDERMPWTGDRTIGCYGESLLMDNASLYAKWLRDIQAMQKMTGEIPDVAPQYWKWSGYTDNVSWPAVFITAADMLYERFGDKRPMEELLPYMELWLDHFVEKKMDNYLIDADKYGDWCMPPESLTLIHSQDPTRITDGRLISTAYFYYLARLLDRHSGHNRYGELCDKIRVSFNETYLMEPNTPNAHYANNTVTANLLALAFDMVPEQDRKAVERQIIDILSSTSEQPSLPCGVIGISWIMRQLSKLGHNDIAYKLATKTSYPGWGYMAEHGATTIWELWNGNTANPKMNSGNHVMLLGDLIPWCFEEIGSLKPTSPGYKTFEIKPEFNLDDLTSVSMSYITPYGLIESKWHKAHDQILWDVTIPPNTEAVIIFPDDSFQTYGSGNHNITISQ